MPSGGDAEPLIDQAYVKNPGGLYTRRNRGLLLALQDKPREAQAEVPRIIEKIPRNKTSHNYAYTIARIYALDGKSEQAVKWLRKTVNEGFPCYPLFARDSFLIRSGFQSINGRDENPLEAYRREFG